MNTTKTIALLITFTFALTSCAFFPKDPDKNSSRAQFLDEVWVTPSLQGKAPSDNYTNVYFAPVLAESLKKQDWWQSQTPMKQTELQMDAYRLATHFNRSLEMAAINNPKRKLNLVTEPTPDTLIVQMAIVELVPAKAFWNTAATGIGFVVPGAGLLKAFGSGKITVAGRVYDGNTGEIVAQFQTSMQDKVAVINLDAMTWYGGSQTNLEDLAKKTNEILNAPSTVTVKESSPVKLIAF